MFLRHERYKFWLHTGLSYALVGIGIYALGYLPSSLHIPYGLVIGGSSGFFAGSAVRNFIHYANPLDKQEMSKRELVNSLQHLFLGSRLSK